MKIVKWIAFLFLGLTFQFCNNSSTAKNGDEIITDPNEVIDEDAAAVSFYYGADLSYVNEMLDCGAIYKDENNLN